MRVEASQAKTQDLKNFKKIIRSTDNCSIYSGYDQKIIRRFFMKFIIIIIISLLFIYFLK